MRAAARSNPRPLYTKELVPVRKREVCWEEDIVCVCHWCVTHGGVVRRSLLGLLFS
jgi:hypothetical protein